MHNRFHVIHLLVYIYVLPIVALRICLPYMLSLGFEKSRPSVPFALLLLLSFINFHVRQPFSAHPLFLSLTIEFCLKFQLIACNIFTFRRITSGFL